MPVQTPVTWSMTAAQLVTPTTSSLSVINAIQTAVTACPDWTVNSTGTSTTGYKWLEVKPTNAASAYSEYRILFVERVNTATNKLPYNGVSAATIFNSASYCVAYLCPDGGASWCTFTPANIETANPVWVGTKYTSSAGAGGSTMWAGIGLACTALWLYTGDGVMYLISRQSPTSHSIAAFGNTHWAADTSRAYNGAGTEIGVPGMYLRNSIGSATMAASFSSTNHTFLHWYYNAATPLYYAKKEYSASLATTLFTTGAYEPTLGSASFYPFTVTSLLLGPSTLRGVYTVPNMKTRTTIQTGGLTIGFTFYPDDAASGASLSCFAFVNT